MYRFKKLVKWAAVAFAVVVGVHCSAQMAFGDTGCGTNQSNPAESFITDCKGDGTCSASGYYNPGTCVTPTPPASRQICTVGIVQIVTDKYSHGLCDTTKQKPGTLCDVLAGTDTRSYEPWTEGTNTYDPNCPE